MLLPLKHCRGRSSLSSTAVQFGGFQSVNLYVSAGHVRQGAEDD